MDKLMIKSTISQYKKKLIFVGIIIAITLIVLAALYYKGYKNATEKYQTEIADLSAKIEELSQPTAIYEQASKEVVLGIINTEIKSIGELATVEYFYTDAGKFSDPKELFGHSIPFTTKSFIAKWEGLIKAGVKIADITTEVDDKSFETLDQKDGLFNPIEIDDIREFDTKSKEAMEIRAVDAGILDKASKSAQIIIEGLLNTYPEISENYEIIFVHE